eukprot:28023_2
MSEAKVRELRFFPKPKRDKKELLIGVTETITIRMTLLTTEHHLNYLKEKRKEKNERKKKENVFIFGLIWNRIEVGWGKNKSGLI